MISIFASISVFFTSIAASTSAIFAALTFFGIPECTTSLSQMIPSMSCVSETLPPCFLMIWMLSLSNL